MIVQLRLLTIRNKTLTCVCVGICHTEFLFITGNTSKVLPDYEKSHVMSLIISHIPEHSTDDMRNAK